MPGAVHIYCIICNFKIKEISKFKYNSVLVSYCSQNKKEKDEYGKAREDESCRSIER